MNMFLFPTQAAAEKARINNALEFTKCGPIAPAESTAAILCHSR